MHFTEKGNHLPIELKELNSSLTTEEMVAEIKELKAENSGYKARLEKIKLATNHVTPEEKEKVGMFGKHDYLCISCTIISKIFCFS